MPENLNTWRASLSAHRVRQSHSAAWAVDTVGLVAMTGQAKLCSSALFCAAGRYQDAMLMPAAESLMGSGDSDAPWAWGAIGAVGGLLGAGVLLAGQLSVSVGWFVLYGAAELCVYVLAQIWDQIHQDPPPPATLRRDRPAMSGAVYSTDQTTKHSERRHAGPQSVAEGVRAGSGDAVRPARHRQGDRAHTGLKHSIKLVGKLARRLEALEGKQESARDAAVAWADKARGQNIELNAVTYQAWVRDLLDLEVTNLSTKYHAVSNVACGALSETKQIAQHMQITSAGGETLSPMQLAPMRQLFHETKRSLATAKSDLDAIDAHYNRAQSAMMAFQRFTSCDVQRREQLPFRMANMMGSGYVVAKTQSELFAVRRATHTFFLTTGRLFSTTIPKAISNLSKLQRDAGQMVRRARPLHLTIAIGTTLAGTESGGIGRGGTISSPDAQPVLR